MLGRIDVRNIQTSNSQVLPYISSTRLVSYAVKHILLPSKIHYVCSGHGKLNGRVTLTFIVLKIYVQTIVFQALQIESFCNLIVNGDTMEGPIEYSQNTTAYFGL